MKIEKVILVVDDEPANVFLLKKILEKQNYSIITSYSGSDCLEKLKNNHIDIVLLDLMMPGINGFEVLSRMKNDATLGNIPVIVLSALNDLRTKERVLSSGAVNYITKPVTIKGILDGVSAILIESNYRKVE